MQNPVNMETHVEHIGGIMLTWTKCGILSTWKHMWNRLGYMNWHDADMDKMRNPVDMETHVEQIGIYELE